MAFIHCSLLLVVVAIIGSSLTASVEPKTAVVSSANSWESKSASSGQSSGGLQGRAITYINTRYLTGTLFGTAYNTLVPHGIPIKSLLTYSVLVNTTTGFYPPNFSYAANYGYQTNIDANYVRIYPTYGNALNIGGKPFLIYIVYTS